MTKKLLLLSFLAFFSINLSATHLMGGELIAKVDNSNQVHFVLTLYRDINGIQFPNTTTIMVQGNGTTSNISLTRISQSVLTPGSPSEENIYTGSMPLNGFGLYTASYYECCRNGSVLNMTNPGSQSFYIETQFTSISGSPNGTPFFMNKPIVVFPVDTPWTYNPLPFDNEGDSIYWAIDTPMSSAGQYVPGYTYPPAHPSGGIAMDPGTGTITWTPSATGKYQLSVLVEEYRNGAKLGEIRRDLQLIVTPDSANMSFSVGGGLNPNGTTLLNANQNFSVSFDLSAVDTSIDLSLDAVGDPFEIPGSNAKFVVTKAASQTITGTFTWQPNVNDQRSAPYRLVIRASDGNMVYDYSILLGVQGVFTLQEMLNNNGAIELFPNPSNGTFTVQPLLIEAGSYTLRIYDLHGKQVYEGDEMVIHSNSDPVPLQLELSRGVYILNLNGEEQSINERLVIE